ncbi:Alpha-N-acetylgalactosaminidase [Acropora cervicornis]|uniref:Alpha-galactosidase n=1 Tax=Acropora cervicornis TaxID=6130 RepID=A0AAD9PTB7_ACRCE|nr:Alpha-N-acetylgalactosaminidase [Acropora cervicornis]
MLKMKGSSSSKCCIVIFLITVKAYTIVTSLDNGLALTPPMGWMAWERFRCNINCKDDPENCISEKLFMEMADHMAEDGFKEAGYTYISIDTGCGNHKLQDCWASHNRTSDGQLQPDPERFPSGIPALARYIHSKGLKLGIYGDYGTKTCAGYPGTIDHIQQDMDTFAAWGVDYLKLDGCYADPKTMDTGYPMVTEALNKTGRPIVFSCSWPAYQVASNITPNYTRIAEYCNLWRNYDDIQDSWASVSGIIKWYGEHLDEMIPAAGPGHWNDPDEAKQRPDRKGQPGRKFADPLTFFQLRNPPLIMSNDLRKISSWAKEILLNSEVIAVNQDKLGKMGRRVQTSVERFLTSRGIRNPEWITEEESENSQVEKKFLFKTSKENQNGLMARPLKSKLPCLRYKVLVRDQLWKCQFNQMHQTNRTSRLQRRSFPRSPEPVLFKTGQSEIWARPLADGAVAAVLFSHSESTPVTISASFELVGLHATQAMAHDLFEHKDLGLYKDSFKAIVNPTGVVMVKLIPV